MDPRVCGEIADAWIKYHGSSRKRRADDDPDFEAWDRVDALVRADPEAAWQVIQAIWQRDQNDLILANLAAGPVEDLLVHHGRQFIGRVEEMARKEPVFRRLLGAVWRNAIREDVWSRLRRVPF
jgi:hypothetical protein